MLAAIGATVPIMKKMSLPHDGTDNILVILCQCVFLSANKYKYILRGWGHHMGLELQNSFKEGPSDQQYGKLTVRHHVFRNYVSPNQTCPVFGLFHYLTSRQNR